MTDLANRPVAAPGPDRAADTPAAALPARGWTAEAKVRFCEHLAVKGHVRAACARVGLSAESAYRLRRRDPLFARGWAAAMVMARDHSEQVMACRALDGVEEPVYYRGELVGTRQRYDTRLLLAHMARLDRAAQSGQAPRDAGRFDHILALLAGEAEPEICGCDAHGLPLPRKESIERAVTEALDALTYDEGAESPLDVYEEAYFALREEVYETAAHDWDAWNARVEAVVDAITGADGARGVEAPAPEAEPELVPESQPEQCPSPAIRGIAAGGLSAGATSLGVEGPPGLEGPLGLVGDEDGEVDGGRQGAAQRCGGANASAPAPADASLDGSPFAALSAARPSAAPPSAELPAELPAALVALLPERLGQADARYGQRSFTPYTLSTVSTSALEQAIIGPVQGFAVADHPAFAPRGVHIRPVRGSRAQPARRSGFPLGTL